LDVLTVGGVVADGGYWMSWHRDLDAREFELGFKLSRQ
jgi:hypothetical protein